MAKICVIVPVYNVEAYIRRCIDSVLAQTFTDFELILIDDGSPDRCGEICDEYSAADSRVTVIHQENQGLSAARNAGIEHAMVSDCEWLTFIDSDDYVADKYLEALLFASQDYGISIGARALTKGEDLPLITNYTVSLRTPSELCLSLKGNFTIVTAKLYRKDLFSEIRFPVGKIHEDAFITHKILFQFDIIPFVPELIYVLFTDNPTSITHKPWTPARLDELEAYADQIDFFVDRGLLDIAEMRFNFCIDVYRLGQKHIEQAENIKWKDKLKLQRKINSQLREILIKYRKYHWCRWWENRTDFWTVADAFGFRKIHRTGKSVKKLLKSS